MMRGKPLAVLRFLDTTEGFMELANTGSTK